MKPLRLFGAFVVVLLLWEALHQVMQGPGVPSVMETFRVLVSIFSLLMRHLTISALRLISGLLLALVLGTLLGLAMGRVPFVNALLSPLVYLLTPLPKVAFLPVAMVLLGISERARIGILVIVVIFPFIVAVRDALTSMDPKLEQTIRSMALKRRTRLKEVLLPMLAQPLFTAMRQALGMGMAVLFFVETFVNNEGIGYFIMNRWGVVNYPQMYAGILVFSCFGALMYLLLDMIERRLCPWRKTSQKPTNESS